LITTDQAQKYGMARGIYAIRWQAPGVLLFPAGMPHNADDIGLFPVVGFLKPEESEA
jgi:hypothetical protein